MEVKSVVLRSRIQISKGRRRGKLTSRETRERKEPVEDEPGGVLVDTDVGDGSEGEDKDNRPKGSTRLVDVAEEFGGESGLGEGGEGSGSGVDARETDGEDGDDDRGVDEVVESLDVGVSEDDDEGGSGRTRGTEESLVVVANEETNDGKGGDVDDGDTPKGVLDSGGDGLSRVGSLGSAAKERSKRIDQHLNAIERKE
jgi:hypothetical protein